MSCEMAGNQFQRSAHGRHRSWRAEISSSILNRFAMRALEEADRAASRITRAISRHSRRLTRSGTERGLKVGISDKPVDPADNEASMTLFILPSVDALFDLSVEGLTYKLTGPAKLTSLLEDATDGEERCGSEEEWSSAAGVRQQGPGGRGTSTGPRHQ